MNTIYILWGIVIVFVLWVIGAFNGLVRGRNRVREAWSDIDVQLKRRHDLIPNLVETVKGYATHEREAFENVTKARSAAMGASSVQAKGEAENQLTGALKSLFAISEAYPELKASANFGKLQDELTDTENKIQAARRFYNTNVMDYNTKLEVFPTNLIGGTFGFKREEFFQAEASEKELPQVKF
jgi:LemA protein